MTATPGRTSELKLLHLISYFDAFEHPVKKEELVALLPSLRDRFDRVMRSLLARGRVEHESGYYFLTGKAKSIGRRIAAEERLGKNLGRILVSAWILSHFPYVRGVFLTGSVSKGIFHEYDDFDFLIVSKRGHLWTCKMFIDFFRRLVSFNFRTSAHKLFCCNSHVSESDLSISDRNEFTALEIAFSRPVYNDVLHERFLRSNDWRLAYFSHVGNGGNRRVRWRIAPLQLLAELLLGAMSLCFTACRLEERMKKYFLGKVIKKYGGPCDEAEYRRYFTDNWIRPEAGNRQKFLREKFRSLESGENNTGFRTRVLLKKGMSDAAPDILLSHSFLIYRTRQERDIMKPYVPLGPLYVAAYARAHGYRAAFYDPTFDRNLAAFRTYLRKNYISLLGLYSTELTRKNAVEMIRIARVNGTGVIVGGPDPSADPGYYLDHGADYAVIGEGEETVLGILDALKSGSDVGDVPGVYSRAKTFVPRERIDNLDALPYPARELADAAKYRDTRKDRKGLTSIMISASRGCPYHCAWCSRSVFGSRFRQRSVRNVVEEMLEVKKSAAPDHIWFSDDNFGFDKNWLARFSRQVTRKDARIPFECFVLPALVTEDYVSSLKKAGCLRVWFGAESGSDRVLRKMRKPVKAAEIVRAAKLAARGGLATGMYVMLAYPGETVADIEATRSLLQECSPDQLIVKFAFPLSGTEFYEEVKDRLRPWRRNSPLDNNLGVAYRTAYSAPYYQLVRLILAKEQRARKGKDRVTDRLKLTVYLLIYPIFNRYYKTVS